MNTTDQQQTKFSFTVDRSKWRCGGEGLNKTGIGATYLLNNQGYQCCLGFACEAAGEKKESIFYKGTPEKVHNDWGSIIKGHMLNLVTFKGHNSEFTCDAICINDNPNLSTAERESQLIELGRKYNININFIGAYNDLQ